MPLLRSIEARTNSGLQSAIVEPEAELYTGEESIELNSDVMLGNFTALNLVGFSANDPGRRREVGYVP